MSRGLHLLVGLVLLTSCVTIREALAFTWPWDANGPWPGSSKMPVETLDHPAVESRIAALDPGPSSGYRFAVFGDQRALADGEWQSLMVKVAEAAATDERFLFMVDTGDNVYDGSHSDQFAMLTGILSPAREVPYLVSVGNHEVDKNRNRVARANTSRYLEYLDPGFSEERMYYAKDIGPVRYLFLDSNDFIYGEDGSTEEAPPDQSGRALIQIQWLTETLADTANAPPTTVVFLHHPFLQTSKKHRGLARSLWETRFDGKALADILADGGVDVIVCGHTHTCEWFRLQRLSDAHDMWLVNISGRPRTSFLWIGDGARRARDVSDDATAWFADRDWTEMSAWQVWQEGAMTADDANQFALITVEPDGGLLMEVRYMDSDAPDGIRRSDPTRLK